MPGMKSRKRYWWMGLALLAAVTLDCWRQQAREAWLAETQLRAVVRDH